jgi:hypothetical protein
MTEQERKNKFVLLMEQHIGLLDASCLANGLEEMGYFTAPASASHHGNYEGGLFDHSWAVMEALVNLTEKLELEWDREASPYLVGLLHDVCKCGAYKYSKIDEQWTYNKDVIMPGHGELSVILAQQLIDLTTEEILCIRWHMGAYDDKENWNILGRAIEYYPNVLYTHTADMIASRIKGV